MSFCGNTYSCDNQCWGIPSVCFTSCSVLQGNAVEINFQTVFSSIFHGIVQVWFLITCQNMYFFKIMTITEKLVGMYAGKRNKGENEIFGLIMQQLTFSFCPSAWMLYPRRWSVFRREWNKTKDEKEPSSVLVHKVIQGFQDLLPQCWLTPLELKVWNILNPARTNLHSEA